MWRFRSNIFARQFMNLENRAWGLQHGSFVHHSRLSRLSEMLSQIMICNLHISWWDAKSPSRTSWPSATLAYERILLRRGTCSLAIHCVGFYPSSFESSWVQQFMREEILSDMIYVLCQLSYTHVDSLFWSLIPLKEDHFCRCL